MWDVGHLAIEMKNQWGRWFCFFVFVFETSGTQRDGWSLTTLSKLPLHNQGCSSHAILVEVPKARCWLTVVLRALQLWAAQRGPEEWCPHQSAKTEKKYTNPEVYRTNCHLDPSRLSSTRFLVDFSQWFFKIVIDLSENADATRKPIFFSECPGVWSSTATGAASWWSWLAPAMGPTLLARPHWCSHGEGQWPMDLKL